MRRPRWLVVDDEDPRERVEVFVDGIPRERGFVACEGADGRFCADVAGEGDHESTCARGISDFFRRVDIDRCRGVGVVANAVVGVIVVE